MPGLDGIETGAPIRPLRPSRAADLLLVTAYGREEVARGGRRCAGIAARADQARERLDPVRCDDATCWAAPAGAGRHEPTERPRPTAGWPRCAARASCWSRTTTSTRRSRGRCWKTRAWSSTSRNGEIALRMVQRIGLRPRVDGHADAGDGRRRRRRGKSRKLPRLETSADHRHDRQRHGAGPPVVPGRRHERLPGQADRPAGPAGHPVAMVFRGAARPCRRAASWRRRRQVPVPRRGRRIARRASPGWTRCWA